MKNSKLEAYIRAKRLIKKAFLINYSIPKGYGTRSSDYDFFYGQKDRLVRKAVALIRENNLSIKYGIKESYDSNYSYNSIIYFEFEGKQYSFHGYFNSLKKQFNGEWQGFRNDPKVALHKRKATKISNGDCELLGYSLVGIKNCHFVSKYDREIKNLVMETRFLKTREEDSGDWRNHYSEYFEKE